MEASELPPAVTAESLLRKACDRHGGPEAFASMWQIVVRLIKLDGLVPRFKGLGTTFSLPEFIIIDPRGLTAHFHYENEFITYDDGAIISNAVSRAEYRKTFSGLHKLRFWTNEDACYFFGYALVGYYGLPFQLNGLELRGAGRSSNGWSWVRVEYPPQADTHCRMQRFWFDDSGLLVRHDYCADIIGPMFWGAHYSEDYCFDHAVPLARRRTVKLRLGRFACPISVLRAHFEIESVG